uniref:Uncharacterized protein n=1 Tax=Amphimedon queenslandica TaxID=400682 RepID=A0A1X7TDM1_AMPQE
MEETDTLMAEVDRVSQQYLPLSTSCSAMYFTLESLNQDLLSPIGSPVGGAGGGAYNGSNEISAFFDVLE